MEWLAFGLVCWAAIHFLKVGRNRARGRWARRAVQAAERPTPSLPPTPAAKPESPEQRLRREYVDGSISVEQYERELDRLYRSGG